MDGHQKDRTSLIIHSHSHLRYLFFISLQTTALTETSLIELERVWEQNWDEEGNEKSTNQTLGTGTHGDGSSGDPAHLQLFYGGTDSACAMSQDTTGMLSDASQPAP
jgi:hypothetical protein